MVLDLVDGGDDLGLWQELLKVLFAVLLHEVCKSVQFCSTWIESGCGQETYVADTNGLGLAGSKDILHLLPRLDVVPLAVDVASAVGVSWELVMITYNWRRN